MMRPGGVETQVRPPRGPRTFTISWTEQSNMSSGWTYSDDAAGLTAGSTDFDEFFGYSVVALQNDGTEISEYTQTQSGGYGKLSVTSVGNTYNVMIKFPVRGIKMTKSGSVVTLSITDGLGREGEGYQYYAHTKGTTIKDNLYLGAYKMSSGYVSKYGKALLTGQTRAEVRNGITSTYGSGTGYSQITWYVRQFINALYMMKYGNPNCRAVVGQGYSYSGNSYPANTMSTYSTTDATFGAFDYGYTQMRLFGIEDRWGNVNEWIEGCSIITGGKLTVDKTNSIFQDTGYTTDLGTSAIGYIGGIGGTNDKMFQSTTSAGNFTTYYCSTFYANGPSDPISAGGCYNNTDEANMLYTSSGERYYARDKNKYGSRLMYL